MSYQELVEKVTKAYGSSDASKVSDHVAIQFNITGEGEGAFYIEVADGKIVVQPFEYYDRDAVVTTTADTMLEIATAALDLEEAFSSGKIWVDGSLDKVLLLKKVSVKKTRTRKAKAESADTETSKEVTADTKKKTSKKTVASEEKKAEEKKTVEKKAEEKKAPAKKATKSTAEKKADTEKTAAKKTAVKKTAAKKAAAEEEASVQMELELK